MKFITFALILQFLIACWPKVDIKAYILLDDTCTCANTRHYTSEQCCCIP